jgi:succinate dehydrogenase assembly factor 1
MGARARESAAPFVISALVVLFVRAGLSSTRHSSRARASMSDRAKVLSLFRKLYRAARSLPTSNRVGFVRAKVRAEYETHRGESDAARIAALRLYGETQLDNVLAQASHLTSVFSDPRAHARA